MNLSEPLQPSGPMPPIAGQTLQPGATSGGFEIVQVLGLTSFGVLYLARSPADGSTVAVKEYMPTSLAVRATDGQVHVSEPGHAEAYRRGLQSFLTEALTLAQLDHPNLLRVSAVWETNGTAYRAMPHLAGSTLLAQRTSSQEPMTQAQLQALLDGLLGALRTVYSAGLAHGQVEPLNICLLDGTQPVLMDFDAVHQAVLSDLRKPCVDAYADPSRTQSLITADLHAVAAVLHFAISGTWTAPRAGQAGRHAPLADVLLRFKDSASVLDYQPEFLAAIDAALALPVSERPGTVTEFRALFETNKALAPSTPAAAHAEAAADAAPQESEPPAPARRIKAAGPASAAPTMSSSEAVLALLTNFNRGPAPAAEDVEPFESPELPTLTEEAEPAQPPLRPNPFDAVEHEDEVAQDPAHVEYTPLVYTPMPRVPRNPWHRRMVIAGIVAFVAASVGALGWQLWG